MKIIQISIVVFLTVCFISCNQTSSNFQNRETPIQEEDEWVEVEEEVEDDCSECNGFGFRNVSCSECGGWGHKTHYVSGTRPKDCSTCYGTGKVRCDKCGGYGYTRCQYCEGHGSFQCTVCHGYGIIVIDPSRPQLSPQCNNCNGTGYEKCTICRGAGRQQCCDNGLTTCPTCWGRGRYGQENYSDTHEEECSYCNGSGQKREYCYNCNGNGKIIVEQTIKKKKSEL